MKDNFIISNFLNSNQIKIVICGLIFNVIYVALTFINETTGYIESFISIYTNPYFILIMFVIMFYNTLKIYEEIISNSNYFTRFSSKSEYVKFLASSIARVSVIIYVIQLVITFIYLNIFHNTSIGLTFIYNDCNCIFYSGYIVLKHIILIYFLFDLLIYLFSIANKKIITIIYLVIFITIPIQLDSFMIYSKNTFIPVHISYFFNYMHYNSFTTELLIFLIFIVLFNLFVKIIKKITWRYL